MLAQRLIEVLSEPYELGGQQAVTGVSIGISVAPGDAREPEQLLKNADLALYRAKADGRGTYRFFEAEMDARMQARRALELDLRRALAENELSLHYQPLIDLKTRQVTGFEALLRWHHPVHGAVPPAEFIPVAEETGIIVPLGEWVLRRACEDARTWPAPLAVAVNISPVQFRHRDLAATVDAVLEATGLAPERLEVEITEGVLIQDTEAVLRVLHRLRTKGVRVAMDDFGTGYSSLSYLRSFPFDKIKIDRSFINDLGRERDAAAIVHTVLSLGARLGMVTTAEGVETQEQVDHLQLEGCVEVQGYYFSPPRSVEGIVELLGQLHQKCA